VDQGAFTLNELSTTDSRSIRRMVLNGFSPWDGLAICGKYSSVVANSAAGNSSTKIALELDNLNCRIL